MIRLSGAAKGEGKGMERSGGEGREGKGRGEEGWRLEAGCYCRLDGMGSLGWIMAMMAWADPRPCCRPGFHLDRPGQLLNCGAASSSPVQSSPAQSSAVPRRTSSTAPLPNQKLVLQLTHQEKVREGVSYESGHK